MVKRNAIATKLTKICTQTQKRAFDVAVGRLYLYMSEHTVLCLFLYWAVHTAPQLARKHRHCHNLKNSGGRSAEWTSYVNMQGLVHLAINCFMTSKKKVDD